MESKLIDISLRDYCAAQAMQGLCANPNFSDMTNEETSQWAYQMADAMLEKISDEKVINEARPLDKLIENLKSSIINKKLTDMLMNCADNFGVTSKAAQADKRAWEHLLVYAPLDVRFKTNNPNRNPHAHMAHEWIETWRKVVSRDARFKDAPFKHDELPAWHPLWEYRWADEQPKPDVVEYVIVAHRDGHTHFSTVAPDILAEFKDAINCKFTFDHTGTVLKNVEMIK